ILFGAETLLRAREARAREVLFAETARALFAGALLVLARAAAQRDRERAESDQERRPLRGLPIDHLARRHHSPPHPSNPPAPPPHQSNRADHAGAVSSAVPRVNSRCTRPSRSVSARWRPPPRVVEKTR